MIEAIHSPLVSVVIPNYNHATFLPRRLDSILSQTLTDYEVIFLDDCSTDSSLKIIEAHDLRHKITHQINNNSNSGSPFIQWKRGLDLARGKYIWIAESDDYADNKFLETLVKPLEEDSSISLSYCRSISVNECDEVVCDDNSWMNALQAGRWDQDFRNDGMSEITEFLSFRNVIANASSAVFRRWDQMAAMVPTQLRYCGDWLFWYHCMTQGGVNYCCQPLNMFRTHSGTSRVVISMKKEMDRLQEFYDVLRQMGMKLSFDKSLGCKNHRWITEFLSDRIAGLPFYVFNLQVASFSEKFSLFRSVLTDKVQKKISRAKANKPV